MQLFLFFSLVSTICSYKIVILSPDMANSDLLLAKKVGETLERSGHDVTVVFYQTFDGRDGSAVQMGGRVKVKVVNASIGTSRQDWDTSQAGVIFDDVGAFDQRMFEHFQRFLNVLTGSCRRMVQNTAFLEWLTAEKFDLAFATHYHACPIGLIHHAKIPAWIWLQTGHLMDYVSDAVGVPLVPSYTPPAHLDLLDEMTFSERAVSFLMHNMGKGFYPGFIANIETQMFWEEIDPDFPDLVELGKASPLVMVNSNELYELPHPTLAKIVNIGGLGYQSGEKVPLPEEFSRLTARGKGTILVSLGTVAPSHMIPQHWKEAFLGAFRRLPGYQFIFKYAGDDLKDLLPANVDVVKWMPQLELLKQPTVRAFITHAGYNSLQEAITAGKPLVTVGLFGDQPKNAKIAWKHGFGYMLSKENISEEAVFDALKEVLENPRYLSSAQRLSKMVEMRPVPPEQLLVKWTEFVAEFRTLENLVPAGTRLNFFQYYSLDVIGLLLALLCLVFFLLFKIVACTVRYLFCRRGRKEKIQ